MMRSFAFLTLAACASKPAEIPNARFRNAPPVYAVNDRRDVPQQPESRAFNMHLYDFDGSLHRRMTRTLELHRYQRARGVNALDEVPDSTWFTNRIGVRDISPEEIAAAPGGVSSPELYKPWTIVSSKIGGRQVGFIMKDTRGEKWLLKFDSYGIPEAETATQVIAGKLLWAFGYNVTEDYVVHLRRTDLVLAPDAKVKDGHGGSRPLGRFELDDMLAKVDVNKHGWSRALASHWLQGVPLGGHPAEGVRPDDPNDTIPHELRRDLRGAYAVFAWLDHTDLHEGNTLDMWVSDPQDPKLHYVKHYFVDYGVAFGIAAKKANEPRFSYEWFYDWGAMARSFVTFGLADRPWEGRQEQPLRGVGMFETTAYDPGAWKATAPSYWPIYAADRFDKFWASKIIIKLTREQIRAAVAAGKLSDPKAAAWLVDTLVARQRATAKYWFERVNPLDEFAIAGNTLCFKDLSIAHAFAPALGTYYTVSFYTRDGTLHGTRFVPAMDAGVTCARIDLAARRDDYTVVRIDTERPAFRGTTYVHIALGPTGQPRVIGIWRS
jgi:hypothetical protein